MMLANFLSALSCYTAEKPDLLTLYNSSEGKVCIRTYMQDEWYAKEYWLRQRIIRITERPSVLDVYTQRVYRSSYLHDRRLAWQKLLLTKLLSGS